MSNTNESQLTGMDGGGRQDQIDSFSTCKIATTTNDPPLDSGCLRECELFWTLISLDRNLLTAITRFVVFVSPSWLAMELVLTLSIIMDVSRQHLIVDPLLAIQVQK